MIARLKARTTAGASDTVKRWLPVLVVAFLTAGLAFFVRDTVRQIVVEPVVYVSWFAWIVLTNLPQWIFWSLLLAFGLLLAASSLRRPPRLRRQVREADKPERGPVERWQRLFAQADGSPTARRRLSRELGRARWIALHPEVPYNAQTFAADSSRKSGAISGTVTSEPLDEALAAYFAGGLVTTPVTQPRRWFGRRPPDALDLSKDKVVTYLEKTLGSGL